MGRYWDNGLHSDKNIFERNSPKEYNKRGIISKLILYKVALGEQVLSNK